LLCGGSCVDTQNDRKNCGVCAKDCGIGDCSKGVCGPRVLASGTGFRALAVDDSGVYFGLGNILGKCPLSGCNDPPDQLAAALVANDIALTVSALYFADGYTLSYVPKTGGVATKVVQGAGISALTSDGTIVSWARFGDVRGQVFTPGSTKLLSVQ